MLTSSYWTARDAIQTLSIVINTNWQKSTRSFLVSTLSKTKLYLLKFPQLKRICLIIIAIKPDWNFKLRISRYFVFLVEADGIEKEIEESLEKLKSLGFIENKQLTTGKKNWLGSIIVLTK